jgi:hypothetical protein
MCVQVRRARFGRAVPCGAAIIMAVAALVLPATPATAQSILQSLFGFLGGSSAPKPTTLAPRMMSPPAVQRPGLNPPLTYQPYTVRPLPPLGQGGTTERSSPGKGTRYRSLCVRTCDGFYFPVGYGVGQSGLQQDQKVCESRCGEIGELYFYPVNGGSIDTAVNFAGRSYKSLPNAFRYRKTLVHGCACKPAPWSTAEKLRHERYARQEAEQAAEAAAAGAAEGAATLAPRAAESAVVLTSGQPVNMDLPPMLPVRSPLHLAPVPSDRR